MEKKKFKFNIIDLLIILLVVGAVAFLAMKFLAKGTIADPDATAYVTLYSPECQDFVIGHTKAGDSVMTEDRKDVGTVVSVTTDDAAVYVETDDGKMYLTDKEGYSSVYIKVEVRGQLNDHGVVIGSQQYAPGHTQVYYAGQAKYYLTVYDVEPAE